MTRIFITLIVSVVGFGAAFVNQADFSKAKNLFDSGKAMSTDAIPTHGISIPDVITPNSTTQAILIWNRKKEANGNEQIRMGYANNVSVPRADLAAHLSACDVLIPPVSFNRKLNGLLAWSNYQTSRLLNLTPDGLKAVELNVTIWREALDPQTNQKEFVGRVDIYDPGFVYSHNEWAPVTHVGLFYMEMANIDPITPSKVTPNCNTFDAPAIWQAVSTLQSEPNATPVQTSGGYWQCGLVGGFPGYPGMNDLLWGKLHPECWWVPN